MAWKRFLGGLGLCVAVATSGACGGGQSTFDVSMTIENSLTFEQLSMVTNCRVVVTGADKADFFISPDSKYPCNNGIKNRGSLGTFGYTSSATSGTVNFEVQLIGNDPLEPPVGSGSGSGAAREGSRTPVMISIK